MTNTTTYMLPFCSHCMLNFDNPSDVADCLCFYGALFDLAAAPGSNVKVDTNGEGYYEFETTDADIAEEFGFEALEEHLELWSDQELDRQQPSGRKFVGDGAPIIA